MRAFRRLKNARRILHANTPRDGRQTTTLPPHIDTRHRHAEQPPRPARRRQRRAGRGLPRRREPALARGARRGRAREHLGGGPRLEPARRVRPRRLLHPAIRQDRERPRVVQPPDARRDPGQPALRLRRLERPRRDLQPALTHPALSRRLR